MRVEVDRFLLQVRQVAQSIDEGGKPLYRFEPVVAGIDAKAEFQKARDDAEANKALLQQAWSKLLTLGEWPVQTRQMKIDVSNGVRSIFRDLQPGSRKYTFPWKGREIDGQIGGLRLSDFEVRLKAVP